MKVVTETIAAIATASGFGGIGIIRISGSKVRWLIDHWLRVSLSPRKASFLSLKQDDDVLDEVIALFFPGPHSFTGEDTLELQGHGSPVVLARILEVLHSFGVRLAKPGEFSERAFLNGKKDLIELEAIADLITSKTEKSAQMAIRSLKGEFSKAIRELGKQITDLRLYIEAAIDFPEEEIDFLSDQALHQRFNQLVAQVKKTLHSVQIGSLMQEGVRVVLMGAPNAGKSSLMNALSGESRSIVTDIPGTTRDIIEHSIVVNGVPVTLIDTAGLRESNDLVEQEGVSRALAASEGADHVFWVVDSSLVDSEVSASYIAPDSIKAPVTIVDNKIDLSQKKSGLSHDKPFDRVACSFKTGEGVDCLKKHLLDKVGLGQLDEEGVFLARTRHKIALSDSEAFVEEAYSRLQQGQGELAAESLRLAQRALAEMLGDVSSDDILGMIFSSFCIGK